MPTLKIKKYIHKSKIKKSSNLKKKKGGMNISKYINNDPNKLDQYARVNGGIMESFKGVKAVIQAGQDFNERTRTEQFKICQDRYLIDFELKKKIHRRHLFAIFDGHGNRGQEFAEVCRTNVRTIFNQELAKPEYHNNLKHYLEPIFNQVFKQLNEDCANSIQDRNGNPIMNGGTTGTIVVIEVNEDNTTNFYCAWKGDSRATYAFKDSDGSLVVKDFSADHKPDTPTEQNMILTEENVKKGCRVTPEGSDGHPARLYYGYMGLAMSRSIGDFEISDNCQPPNPEVKIYNEDQKPEYIILASDGIWEFINSRNAYYDLIKDQPENIETVAQKLVTRSTQYWRKEEGSYRDDISLIVIKVGDFINAEKEMIREECNRIKALEERLLQRVNKTKTAFNEKYNSETKNDYGLAVKQHITFVVENIENLELDPNKNLGKRYIVDKFSSISMKREQNVFTDSKECQNRINSLCGIHPNEKIIFFLIRDEVYVLNEVSRLSKDVAFPIEKLQLSKESFFDKMTFVKCYVFRVLVDDKVVYSFKINKEKIESGPLRVFKGKFGQKDFYNGFGKKPQPDILYSDQVKDILFPGSNATNTAADESPPPSAADLPVSAPLATLSASDLPEGAVADLSAEAASQPLSAPNLLEAAEADLSAEAVADSPSPPEAAVADLTAEAVADSPSPSAPDLQAAAVADSPAGEKDRLGGKNQSVTGNKKSRRLLKSFQKKSSIKKIKKSRN